MNFTIGHDERRREERVPIATRGERCAAQSRVPWRPAFWTSMIESELGVPADQSPSAID